MDKLNLNQSFIEISQDLMVALDREGNVLYINPKGCEILQEKESNIIGCNWFDHFFDRNLNEEVKSVYLDLVNGNKEFSEYFENTIVTSRGENVMLSWHNKAIYDEKGKIIYVLSAGKDISVREDCKSKLKQATLALELVVDKLKPSTT